MKIYIFFIVSILFYKHKEKQLLKHNIPLGQTFFYFSSFKNPDRIFSRNGIILKFRFFNADRMKTVPYLKKKTKQTE